ncbi:jg22799 [Pararge aegeria aegeria]|uniref:Jg22799 protein n=1 Tax=Pararge aegeria aegeria TaxID=348720 RepID=A0A8S4R105_9NEOP|nr:jg22799 [Pararge aegeria aegeria]
MRAYITIPHDDNLKRKKYLNILTLLTKLSAMWSVESIVIVPVVVPVNDLVAKSFNQNLKKLSLGCCIKDLIQKVVLETARIVRRFVTLEP